MSRRKIIAYDLGTSGNKASLYDADGACLESAFVPYDTLYPRAGWHEQRPADWWRAITAGTRQLVTKRPGDAADVECLAISGHSLGAVPLDQKGRLLRESTPIWSDARAEAQAGQFFRDQDPSAWYRRTGNGFPAALYTLFKILWYRQHEPDLFRQLDTVIGTKDYINFRLTGRVCTDPSYASGSGAYDLAEWKYSERIIARSGLPRELFPEIVPSTHVIGEVLPQVARELGLPSGVKVVAGGVDNSCMALGARNIADGRVYTSLGSSAWIAVSSRQPVLEPQHRPYVFTHVIPGMFTSAVSIFSAGTSLRWVRDTLCPDLLHQGGKNPYALMDEAAARSPVGARRLVFNPSLAGGSSQEASPHIRGAFVGLDLSHRRDDMIRACLEGVAMNLGSVLQIFRGLTSLSGEMTMVGGGSRSPLWLQIFADVYEMDVVKTNVDQDAGSLGAAALAAVGCGLWKDFNRIDDIHQVQARLKPIAADVARYRSLRPAFELVRSQQAAAGNLMHSLALE